MVKSVGRALATSLAERSRSIRGRETSTGDGDLTVAIEDQDVGRVSVGGKDVVGWLASKRDRV